MKPDKEKFKKNLPLIVLTAVGLLLIIIGGTIGKKRTQDSETYTDLGYYTAYLEERITELCESVDGIDSATVLLTLDKSTEQVYESDGGTDFLILSDSDGERAVKLCEIYPRVRGVAVVCTNGDIPRIRETVVELLSASLGIPSSDIEVAGGK